MEDFKNRLLEFIEHQCSSVRGFERMCKLTNGTVQSIGAKGPSVDVLYKISDAFPELDLNWLVTGAGDMLKGHIVHPAEDYLTASLKKENDLLKQLLEEKERTIQILLNK